MAHNHADHNHPHSHDGAHDHKHDHAHTHDLAQGHKRTRAGDRITAAGTKVSESGIECCSHHEIEIERYMRLYLLGGVLVLVTTICNLFGLGDNQVAQLPAMIGAVMLGLPLFIAAGREVVSARLSSSSLAALAIVAALVTGEYAVAGWLAFILVVFGQLVRRSASGAQRAIAELVELTPDVARLIADGAEREVPLARSRSARPSACGPGENLPVDGRVITGRSTINQASLTGEAAPGRGEPGDPVYAGTVNLTGGSTSGHLRSARTRRSARSRSSSPGRAEPDSAPAPDRAGRRLLRAGGAGVAAVVWFFMSRSGRRGGAGAAGIRR
jgi:cation transport ATPase